MLSQYTVENAWMNTRFFLVFCATKKYNVKIDVLLIRHYIAGTVIDWGDEYNRLLQKALRNVEVVTNVSQFGYI